MDPNQVNQPEVVVPVERKVVKISKKKFVYPLVFIFVLMIIWGINSVVMNTFDVGPMSIREDIIPCVPGPGVYCDDGSSSVSMLSKSSYESDYYRGNNQEPSIRDTREFMKTSYEGRIKTRKVEDVTKDVRNIIQGAEGRVDNFSVSEEYGYMNFVVAKSNFEDFQSEMDRITKEKLYSVSISSENLLSQKQGIEEATGNIVNSLGNYQDQKTTLDKQHAQIVSVINKELVRIKNELVSLRLSISYATEETALNNLRYQENLLIEQEQVQKQKLAAGNKAYTSQSTNLANLINNENNNLTQVNKQDSHFTDNIETVNGSVSIRFVTLWELATIYSPISPVIIIIVLVIILIIYLKRRRAFPVVQFV